MKWSLKDETLKSNKLLNICLKEIKSCQNLSMGPFFVVCIELNE